MKKIIFFLALMFAVCVYAQNSSQTTSSIDTTNQMTYQLQNMLNKSGSLIEAGARLKNNSITIAVVGGIVGGTLTGIGAYKNMPEVYIPGAVVTGASGLAAFIINMIGNKRIKEGGRILRKVQLSGNGVTVNF